MTNILTLPLENGLRIGEWSARRCRWDDRESEIDLLIVRPALGLAFYVPCTHSGWFRTRTPEARWRTYYSNHSSDPCSPDLEPWYQRDIASDPRTPDWPAGEYVAAEWRIVAEADRLRLWHTGDRIPVSLHGGPVVWTLAKKPFPDHPEE